MRSKVRSYRRKSFPEGLYRSAVTPGVVLREVRGHNLEGAVVIWHLAGYFRGCKFREIAGGAFRINFRGFFFALVLYGTTRIFIPRLRAPRARVKRTCAFSLILNGPLGYISLSVTKCCKFTHFQNVYKTCTLVHFDLLTRRHCGIF